MANVSAFGISGVDHANTIFESANNYFWNNAAAEDNFERSAAMLALNYDYYLKGLENGPSSAVAGLEKAGLNPILAANSSAGSFSSSMTPGQGAAGDGGHSGGGSVGNPLQIAQSRAGIAQANSSAKAQMELANLYKVQSQRMRYIPVTESDNGGVSILGTGFNTGGTDTLLFDTSTGQIVRPKDGENSSSAHDAHVDVQFGDHRERHLYRRGSDKPYHSFNIPR